MSAATRDHTAADLRRRVVATLALLHHGVDEPAVADLTSTALLRGLPADQLARLAATAIVELARVGGGGR